MSTLSYILAKICLVTKIEIKGKQQKVEFNKKLIGNIYSIFVLKKNLTNRELFIFFIYYFFIYR